MSAADRFVPTGLATAPRHFDCDPDILFAERLLSVLRVIAYSRNPVSEQIAQRQFRFASKRLSFLS